MSRYLSSAAAKEFDTMVKQAYQAKGGRIRPTIIQRTAVLGDTYNFRLMQSGMATEKTISSADVAVMDINHQLVSATLKNYTAAEYTDIFDAASVNFDEKQALAESVAMAIKRREDQLIISAFASAKVDNNKNYLSNSISGSSASLTVEAVLKASEILDDAYADGQKYMLITPAMRSSLLNNAKVTQSFYVDVKALVTGQLEEFAGFKFIYVESSRKEGGLPKLTKNEGQGVTGDKLAFAYVENAAGIAIGVDMRTEVTYVPEKTSWLTNCLFKAGATVIDPDGVVKIACKDS